MSKIVRTVSAATLGAALCFSSTVASAAAIPVTPPIAPLSISPFVALSAYGTMQSRAAVCTNAVGTAAAGAAGQAAVAGQAAPGCVLPVTDPAAPVVSEAAPVAAPVEAVPVAAGFGLGLGALLAGLVAVAGIAAVVLSDDDEGALPISPD